MWKSIQSLDRILKGEATRLTDLRRGTLDIPLGGLSLVILILGAFYGACMGAFAIITRHGTGTAAEGYQQLLASAVKVPALFFLTLAVTFPSLYVFNALVGSRLSLPSLLRLLVAALAVMMALLASFGTITVFFAVSTDSYAFMVLLNVVLFAVAGFLGLGFLLSGVTFLLATILGTLRDGGRDIQRAVGGRPVDLVKPLTAKLFPPVMMMGLMVLMVLMVLMGALVAGIVVGVDQSNYWLHASSQVAGGPQTAALSPDLSDIQSIRAWLQPLDFVGMGLILSGIVLALATI